MADLTPSDIGALFTIGIITRQEARDSLGFPGVTETIADGDPATPAPIPGTTQQFVPQQVIPQQAAPQGPPPLCPAHHASHFVPAGKSKKPPYKAYGAFWGCTDMDCRWRVDA
jgi:hypothetical protein